MDFFSNLLTNIFARLAKNVWASKNVGGAGKKGGGVIKNVGVPLIEEKSKIEFKAKKRVKNNFRDEGSVCIDIVRRIA